MWEEQECDPLASAAREPLSVLPTYLFVKYYADRDRLTRSHLYFLRIWLCLRRKYNIFSRELVISRERRITCAIYSILEFNRNTTKKIRKFEIPKDIILYKSKSYL